MSVLPREGAHYASPTMGGSLLPTHNSLLPQEGAHYPHTTHPYCEREPATHMLLTPTCTKGGNLLDTQYSLLLREGGHYPHTTHSC